MTAIKVRTMPTPPRTDRQFHGDDQYCICCGKKVNPKRMWAVHIIDGGSSILHPDDEHLYVSDAGEMGCHMIGSECRKQFGDFAFKWQ
jgi:hypothetical protein